MRLAARRPSYDQTALSPTEKMIATIWARHIPHIVSARTISPTDSFFDLGGHSLIAQYVLLDLRKDLVGTSVPISALFQKPTLRAFASELDRLQDPIGLNLETADENAPQPSQQEYYSNDRKILAEQLPKDFLSSEPEGPRNILLTGATGFLGAHILHLLVKQKDKIGKIFVHVRASNAASGLERIKNTCTAYGLSIDDRVSCVPGDLAAPKLGIDNGIWQQLSEVQ
jgi:L-aminoadipate-semialdehyde dehydrogenase